MIRRLVAAVLVFSGVVVAACGASNPEPNTPECATFTRAVDFVADPTFTEDERAAISVAVNNWAGWSSGRIRLSVTYGVPVGTPARIVRTSADKDPLASMEAERRKTFDLPGYTLWGLTTGDPPRIYLAMDRIPPADLHMIVSHEMGHAAGLYWPDCNDEPRAAMFPNGKKDCAHVNTPGSLMFPAYDGPATAWGPADVAFCRASCLCP